MKIIKEYVENSIKELLIELPVLLYHYTQAGDEIIKSNCFRLTKYSCFKGDINEFKWGLDFIDKTVGAYYPKLATVLREYTIIIFEHNPYYVGSFCLSKFNDYLLKNYGSPISFNFDTVHKPVIVGRVVYGCDWINRVFDDIFQMQDNCSFEYIVKNRPDLVRHGLKNDNALRSWMLIEAIIFLLPFVKHEKFREEDEVRVIYNGEMHIKHNTYYNAVLNGTLGFNLAI